MHFLPAQEHAGGQQRQPAAISEREPSPTDAVGNFALASGDRIIAAVEATVAARTEMPDTVKIAIAPTIPHHCSERFLRDYRRMGNLCRASLAIMKGFLT